MKSLAEANIASLFPIGILDFKNPNRGSLGAISSVQLQKIAKNFCTKIPLSLALGELLDWFDDPKKPETIKVLSLQKYLAEGHRFMYAKVGLAGTKKLNNWQDNWLTLQHALPPEMKLVGVAYADFQFCDAPNIEELIDFLIMISETSSNSMLDRITDYSTPVPPSSRGLHLPMVVLMDTFRKTKKTLLDYYRLETLTRIASQLRDRKLQFAIAGRLQLAQLEDLWKIQPDWIGFRGAVCREGRNHLDRVKLESLFQNWQKIGGLPNLQ